MMGRRVMAEPLFYNFRFKDHVPTNHPPRAVDRLLDTGFVRKVMAPFRQSVVGRPAGYEDVNDADRLANHRDFGSAVVLSILASVLIHGYRLSKVHGWAEHMGNVS